MKKYSHLQVLTVRELRVGDVLHAGRSVGLCVEWRIVEIAPDKSFAIAQIGNSRTYFKLTGKEIRDPRFPMFRKEDCPLCPTSKLEEVRCESEPNFTTLPQLEAEDVQSSLSNLESRRRGNDPRGGGAHMRTPRQSRRDIVERAERALRKQTG